MSDLDEQIQQIQYDCWSDEGKHTPESSSCQECHNQFKALIEERERETEKRMYEGGEKMFIRMLLDHGFIVGYETPDAKDNLVSIKIPRPTVQKYFDGELEPLQKGKS